MFNFKTSLRLAAVFAVVLATIPSWDAGAQNTQCSNRPLGDSTNACANTRFVTTAIAAVTLPSQAANTMLANATAAPAVPTAVSLTTWMDSAACGTNGQVLGRVAGTWTCVAGGGLTVGTTTVTGGTSTGVLYNNAGVLGASAGLTFVPAGPLTISPTAASFNRGLVVNQSGPTTGSTAGPLSYNLITVADSGNTLTGSGRDAFDLFFNVSSAWRVNDTVGPISGGGAGPIRIAGTFALNYVGTGALDETVGVIGSSYSNNSPGALWGAIGYASLGPTGSAAALIAVAAEVAAETGSTVTRQAGFLAISEAPVQGSTLDAAIVVAAQNVGKGTPAGFKNVISISNSWFSNPALSTTASFFSADSAITITNWANMSNVTISGNIMLFPNLNIPGAASGFTLPTHPASAFQFGGTDATAVRMQVDAFTGPALFTGTRANTSSTAPSAVLLDQTIAAFSGSAYNSGGTYTETGSITLKAAENQTGSAKGSYITLATTATGATTPTDRVRVTAAGRLAVGDLTSPDTTLTVNNNTGAPDAPGFGTNVAHFISANTTLSGIWLDNYGTTASQAFFSARLAGGTKASKTATGAGHTIFSFFGQGYDGSVYSTVAAIDFNAFNAQSGTDHSGNITFRTVAGSSLSLVEVGRFHASGGFSVGTTTDPGIGTVSANVKFTAAGNAGLTVTKTVRASGGAADCTLIFTGGLLTGGTC